MTQFGVDYAWGRPGVPALRKAKVKWVARYLSHDRSGKNLTKAEAQVLTEAGIWIVVVWETTARRMLAGHDAGARDARDALKQANACGMPHDAPIYFAADWDATLGQQSALHAYLDGAASVLGRNRVGMYAGYGPLRRAFDAKKITFGWQTYAWSGGRWDKRAHLQQYSNGHSMNGVSVDHNRAMVADYGQWKIGASPKPTPAPTPQPAPPWPGRTFALKTPRMHGEDVNRWQQRMKRRGWTLGVDGIYGPESAKICRAFQKQKGLKVTGKVDGHTWAAAWTAPIT